MTIPWKSPNSLAWRRQWTPWRYACSLKRRPTSVSRPTQPHLLPSSDLFLPLPDTPCSIRCDIWLALVHLLSALLQYRLGAVAPLPRPPPRFGVLGPVSNSKPGPLGSPAPGIPFPAAASRTWLEDYKPGQEAQGAARGLENRASLQLSNFVRGETNWLAKWVLYPCLLGGNAFMPCNPMREMLLDNAQFLFSYTQAKGFALHLGWWFVSSVAAFDHPGACGCLRTRICERFSPTYLPPVSFAPPLGPCCIPALLLSYPIPLRSPPLLFLPPLTA